MNGQPLFSSGLNFAFYQRPRAIDRGNVIKRAHAPEFFRDRYVNSFQSIQIIVLEYRAFSCCVVSLHCGKGGLAIDRSPTDIFHFIYLRRVALQI